MGRPLLSADTSKSPASPGGQGPWYTRPDATGNEPIAGSFLIHRYDNDVRIVVNLYGGGQREWHISQSQLRMLKIVKSDLAEVIDFFLGAGRL